LPWLVLTVLGCDPGTGSTALRARPDQTPASVKVVGGSFEFGFVTARKSSTLSIQPFAITKTPITVGEYKQCVAAGACSAPALDTPACSAARVPVVEGKTYDTSPSADGLPLTCVEPQSADAYCAWIGGALPTIEQWVYAARGPNIQEFAWGQGLPDCSKHQRAIPIRGQNGGCCPRKGCEPNTFYAVGQHPDVVSPEGMLDVLLTPNELLRGHGGAPISSCSNQSGVCVVHGVLPGAIHYAASVASDIKRAYVDPGAVSGFRCAFEVNP
jgi:hypothetical protein